MGVSHFGLPCMIVFFFLSSSPLFLPFFLSSVCSLLIIFILGYSSQAWIYCVIEMLGMVMNYLICNFIGSAAFFFCTLCFLERDKQVVMGTIMIDQIMGVMIDYDLIEGTL